jgi:hypothetical protein
MHVSKMIYILYWSFWGKIHGFLANICGLLSYTSYQNAICKYSDFSACEKSLTVICTTKCGPSNSPPHIILGQNHSSLSVFPCEWSTDAGSSGANIDVMESVPDSLDNADIGSSQNEGSD